MRKVYTVSQLNRETKILLADHYLSIRVEGEISNMASPASGHIYFTLKDSSSQVRCAMFRTNRRKLEHQPGNGDHVIVSANVGLYEARGEYQLIVTNMEEAGDGALQRAFEQLKRRLSEEGLFDQERKNTIPRLPTKIGIITSPTGAAIRDILSVLKRRFPSIPVVIFPVAVQGIDAKYEITATIEKISADNSCDVLLISRGGGSLEDLWAFNEETVARAIANCPIPIVTGIGHETDFTIADFVADLRAPTPSAAAESVTPDQVEWILNFSRIESQLLQIMRAHTNSRINSLQWISKRLHQVHPGKRLQDQEQRLDELDSRIRRSMSSRINHATAHIATTMALLLQHNPTHRLVALQSQHTQLSHRLNNAISRTIEKRQQILSELARTLHTVSPLATLSRGYAIVSTAGDGNILRSSDEVVTGDEIETRLAKGRLICLVEKTLDS